MKMLMRLLIKPLHLLYVLYAFALFVALMIPVFIWSLLMIPFGRIRGGNLVYTACKLWADIWFPCILIRHQNIYLQKPDHNRSYIYVSNHISYLDAAIIPKAFRAPVRPLGKVEMTKVPVFGFIYKNVIVSVDRSSAANRTRSVQQLKAVLRKGVSILVFPEGTFNLEHRPLKDFYDGAFRIAIETGTAIKPVLLLDAYSRMHYRSIFSLNPGRNRALFMEEISVEGLTLEDLPQLKKKVYEVMEEKLREYGAAWIDELKYEAVNTK